MRGFIGLLVLATACTGSIGPGGGGGDDDGSGSGPPPTNVGVTVRDGYAPQANIKVIFQNADDSVISEVTTDASGTATAPMPNGGNLTVIRTYPPPTPPAQAMPTEVFTYVGVKAGDNIVVGHEIDTLDTPSAIEVKVPDGANGTVTVTAACGTGQGNPPYVAVSVAGCAPNLEFFVQDGNRDSFIAKAPYGSAVDFSADELAQALTSELSSADIATDTTEIDAEIRIVDGATTLYTSGQKRVDQNPQQVNLPNVTGVDELLVATIQGQNGNEMLGQRVPYMATPTAVDGSAYLIPYVTGNVTYSPTGFSWSEDGSGTADFVIGTLDVTRGPSQPGQTFPENEYVRYVIAPHSGTSLALPLLAGADGIYNPTNKDQITGTHGLGAMTGGYDAARAGAFSVQNIVQNAPMNGTVTLSYSGNPPTLP
ncbi:MAG TPA: hypothetical protein VLX92_05745 [Kofleriaceae bacterium]|nr:hypothetical protein [Kofleriaceae bacterium]